MLSKLLISSLLKRFINCNKLLTMSQSTCIGTHNGTFHCDDVFACYLLKQLPQYSESKIVRTRDQSILDGCDVVVDVGGVYDHAKRRYDHHQREFNHTLQSLDSKKEFDIKLSSAGLIYHHYGREIIKRLLSSPEKSQTSNEIVVDDYQTEILFDKIYESFVQEIDAIDNGVNMFDGKPKYTINTDLSSRVGNLRPFWNEDSSDAILLERFFKAITLVGNEFEDRVKYYGKVWYPAKMAVKEAISNRQLTHSSGSIISFTNVGGVPWKDHLFAIEKELGIEGEIKFAIFQDTAGSWRVACVPIFPKSFVLRLPLHVDWRGLRDKKLFDVSGIPGCIFIHATGFIGGATTKEACIALAEKTILFSKEDNTTSDTGDNPHKN